MHRFLSLSRTSIDKYQRVSFCSFFDLNRFTISNRTCYLCGKITNSYNNVQIRQQSTITSLNKNPKKERKKRSKSKKLYAELLIVTDSSSKQQKANVKKLTSNDLKLLATTSLNLSELYKLKDNKFIAEHTYSNLGIIETIPNSSDVLIVPVPVENNNQTEIPPVQSEFDNFDGDLTNIPPINTFQPEELEDHNEPVEEIKTRSKTDQKHYEEIVSKTLAAFVEVCCLLKSPQRGLNAVYFHRGRAKKISDKFFTTIKNIDVYNALLKGFASRADWDKCLEILEIVKEDELVLNVQSFVALFECLGRLNFDGNHLRDIRVVVKECRRLGITFDEIMNKGLFENDIRTIVLKAIQAHDPQYAPHYGPPNLQYNNHLVDHLNNPKQLMHQDEEYKKNGGLFTPILLKSLVEEQMNLEINGYLTIKSIESRDEPTREIIAHRKTLEDHYKMWKEAAHVAFTRDLSTLTAQRSSLNYEPYMRCLPVKDYVTIILEEAKKLAQGSETFSPTVHMLYRDMGSKVYTRYKILRKQKSGIMEKICNIHNKYCEYYARDHGVLDVLPNRNVDLNTRQQWQWIDHSSVAAGPTLDLDHQEWVPTILQFIGKFLYHIVMHDLKIDVNSLRTTSKNKNYLPAFYTIFRTQGRIVKEEVKPHPVLSRLYRNSVPETLTFPAEEVPMLCPPVPWISIKTGSYLLSSTDVVRLPYKASSQKQRLKEADPVQLYPSFDALNQLAAVPWKVNQNMLEIILKVFNEGGSSKLDVPEPPSSLPVPPSPVHDMDKTEKYQLFRQKLQYRRKKAEMYSLWCDCLHRLSLAHHFRNEIFWLPHNMDFRGRVYPIPPHLNHLGSDLARSILVFAEARPLGPNGLDWLKLHLINLTGLKKRDSVAVRLQYAEEMLDTILDSADNPLDGQKWWMESDEPWQTLACCIEVAKAIRSGEPEKYCTHFPIHQDGSCNGLQHYAALGRDSAGAYSVNLAPSEVPQDVYSAVAVLVEEQRRIDAENGIEIAKILEGFVKRKVIKQTVMTTVYGVTRFGARLQIAKQLKDIDDFPKDFVWSASSYLTGRTFDSLRTMFTSTKEIQDWFTDCARLISSVGGQHVEWVTPLGLPVVQPYFKYKKLSSSQIYESYALDKYEKPNVMKQKNAFPPNFIHSLDSSHMMLTSLHCERAGITFVSVHDCYWTHPSTVHIMNKICRDQFVALHSEPILENLSLHLTEKYSYSNNDLAGDGSVVDLTKKKLNRILRQLPKTGDFDINKVLDSVYFFS